MFKIGHYLTQLRRHPNLDHCSHQSSTSPSLSLSQSLSIVRVSWKSGKPVSLIYPSHACSKWRHILFDCFLHIFFSTSIIHVYSIKGLSPKFMVNHSCPESTSYMLLNVGNFIKLGQFLFCNIWLALPIFQNGYCIAISYPSQN